MAGTFGNTQWLRKPKGHFIIEGREVADLAQCCHCNMQFVMIRGSGNKRGYCMNCDSITCGRKCCDTCVPFEKKLEELEAGKRASLILPGE